MRFSQIRTDVKLEALDVTSRIRQMHVQVHRTIPLPP